MSRDLMALCLERRALRDGEVEGQIQLNIGDIVHVLGHLKLTPSRPQSEPKCLVEGVTRCVHGCTLLSTRDIAVCC